MAAVMRPSEVGRAVSSSEAISSVWIRLRLFASSFVPLWVISALRQDDGMLAGAFILLAVAGTISAILILVDVHRLEPNPCRIEDVSDRGSEVAGYLATYLLPFLMVPDPTSRDVLSYLTFILVVAVVYLQSNMLAVNPLLYVLGLRVTGVTTTAGSGIYLVSRSLPRRGEVVLAAEIGHGVLLATRSRQ
jgi:hypothetical protein